VVIGIIGGVIVALLAVAYALYQRSRPGDVRGSSTQEFVPTEPAPRVPKPRPSPRTPSALARVDWPTYGFDPRRLRYLPSELAPPFRTIWRFRARTLLEFPPALGYGHAYIANNAGVLFAVDAKTGRATWRYRSRRCTAASPAVAKGLVYMTFLNRRPCNQSPGTPGLDGELVALDARRGTVAWRKRLAPSESSPLVAGGLVYVGDWGGNVLAFDARTGRERWRYATGGEIKGAVAVSGRRLYVGSYDHHVYALDARTGRLIWRASAQDRLFGSTARFYSNPAAAYGRLYIGGTDGKVYSFGQESGELRWAQSTGGYVYASPAVFDERILVGSYSGTFYSLDAATGDVKWQFRANGPISGSATVIGNIVYFGTFKGRTYGLDARSGKLVWSFPDGQYGSVVAGSDRFYLVGRARLYAMAPR
jgi:outer membrane protein assembly factor BamB